MNCLEQPAITITDAAVQDALDVAIAELDASAKSQRTNWNKIPEVHKETKCSAKLQNGANLISQDVSASAASMNNNSHVAPTLVSSNTSGSSTNNIAGSSRRRSY